MSKVLAACAALALCLPASAAPKKAKTTKKESPMEWTGAYCEVAEASHRVVATPAEWEKLWKEIGRPAPPADLAAHYAVAVFLGTRNTGGFGVAFEPPASAKEGAVVRYKVKTPRGMVIQALTQPYAVRLYPKTKAPVRVEAIPD